MDPTILIPLDGMRFAEQALPFAEALAQATAAPLLIVHTSEGARHTDDLKDQPEPGSYLERVVNPLRQRELVVLTTTASGEIVEAVTAAAKHYPIGLIVMTTRGRGPIGGSSTAQQLLAQLAVPVLLVREWHSPHFSSSLSTGARIIVPLDGSTLAEAAIPLAKKFGAALEAELILLRIIAPRMAWVPASSSGSELVRRQATAQRYLEAVATMLKREGIRATVEIAVGDASEGINAAVVRHNAALVILTTCGQNTSAMAGLGRVAKVVCWCGLVPIMLTRPPIMTETQFHEAVHAPPDGTLTVDPGSKLILLDRPQPAQPETPQPLFPYPHAC